jgi:hypothetical protein
LFSKILEEARRTKHLQNEENAAVELAFKDVEHTLSEGTPDHIVGDQDDELSKLLLSMCAVEQAVELVVEEPKHTAASEQHAYLVKLCARVQSSIDVAAAQLAKVHSAAKAGNVVDAVERGVTVLWFARRLPEHVQSARLTVEGDSKRRAKLTQLLEKIRKLLPECQLSTKNMPQTWSMQPAWIHMLDAVSKVEDVTVLSSALITVAGKRAVETASVEVDARIAALDDMKGGQPHEYSGESTKETNLSKALQCGLALSWLSQCVGAHALGRRGSVQDVHERICSEVNGVYQKEMKSNVECDSLRHALKVGTAACKLAIAIAEIPSIFSVTHVHHHDPFVEAGAAVDHFVKEVLSFMKAKEDDNETDEEDGEDGEHRPTALQDMDVFSHNDPSIIILANFVAKHIKNTVQQVQYLRGAGTAVVHVTGGRIFCRCCRQSPNVLSVHAVRTRQFVDLSVQKLRGRLAGKGLKLRRAAKRMNKRVQEVCSHLIDMNHEWEGWTGEKFSDKLDTLKEKRNTLVEKFKMFKKLLDKPDEVHRAEATVQVARRRLALGSLLQTRLAAAARVRADDSHVLHVVGGAVSDVVLRGLSDVLDSEELRKDPDYLDLGDAENGLLPQIIGSLTKSVTYFLKDDVAKASKTSRLKYIDGADPIGSFVQGLVMLKLTQAVLAEMSLLKQEIKNAAVVLLGSKFLITNEKDMAIRLRTCTAKKTWQQVHDAFEAFETAVKNSSCGVTADDFEAETVWNDMQLDNDTVVDDSDDTIEQLGAITGADYYEDVNEAPQEFQGAVSMYRSVTALLYSLLNLVANTEKTTACKCIVVFGVLGCLMSGQFIRICSCSFLG